MSAPSVKLFERPDPGTKGVHDPTPIYVPPERLRRELAARNFTDFVELAGGRGTSLLARKLSASAA